MNFDKLFTWIAGMVIAAAMAGQLPDLQFWIWKAQANIMHESRTATWGSPRFFDPKRARR